MSSHHDATTRRSVVIRPMGRSILRRNDFCLALIGFAENDVSFLKVVNLADLGEPKINAPLPERAIEGNQVCSTWVQDETSDGDVSTGIWEITPGAYRSIKGTSWELCSILSGVSEITEDGKPAVVVKAGDIFIMRPGFEGVWRVIETTRKLWVTKG